jgi:Flp pilus assembly protein TadG
MVSILHDSLRLNGKPFCVSDFLGGFLNEQRFVHNEGNSIIQAALVLPILMFLFVGVLQFGSVVTQISSLNSGIESAVSACDFYDIAGSTDKNAALEKQILQNSPACGIGNLKASNTSVEKQESTLSATADRQANQAYSVTQSTTKAHLTADLTYKASLFVNVFGFDGMKFTRHIDAWQTVENDVRFSEE